MIAPFADWKNWVTRTDDKQVAPPRGSPDRLECCIRDLYSQEFDELAVNSVVYLSYSLSVIKVNCEEGNEYPLVRTQNKGPFHHICCYSQYQTFSLVFYAAAFVRLQPARGFESLVQKLNGEMKGLLCVTGFVGSGFQGMSQ